MEGFATGPLLKRGALVGKIGSFFCSSVLHRGMFIVEMCRFQGEHVARIASQMAAGAGR